MAFACDDCHRTFPDKKDVTDDDSDENRCPDCDDDD